MPEFLPETPEYVMQAMARALQSMLDHYGPPSSVADQCEYPEWHAITQSRKALSAHKAITAVPSHAAAPICEEHLKAAWEKGRNSWCPAGVLADEARTEQEWRKAYATLTEAPASAAESVALWQRQQPGEGTWVEVLPESLEFYRDRGQKIRALYARPAPSITST